MTLKARSTMEHDGELWRRSFCLASCLAERHERGMKQGIDQGKERKATISSLWCLAPILLLSTCIRLTLVLPMNM
jgi:hypothetical protein